MLLKSMAKKKQKRIAITVKSDNYGEQEKKQTTWKKRQLGT